MSTSTASRGCPSILASAARRATYPWWSARGRTSAGRSHARACAGCRRRRREAVGVPSDRRTTRSRSPPSARPRPDRAVRVAGGRSPHGAVGISASTTLCRSKVSKRTRKRSRVASICSSIRGTGSPASRASSTTYSPAVAVLGRLLPRRVCLDGPAEPVHLRARVVVVVLPLDIVPGELEQARDGVAVHAVSRRGDGDLSRSWLAEDELTWIRSGGSPKPDPNERPAASTVAARPEPCVVDREVQEAGARDVDAGDPVHLVDALCELRRDLPRRPATLAGLRGAPTVVA